MARTTAAPARELARWRAAEVTSTPTGEALAAAIPRAPGSTEPESERAARLAIDAKRAAALRANWAAGDPAGFGYGLTAWRKVTRVNVPADLHRDRVPGAGRPGRCYQEAFTYVLDHSDRGAILVHGLVVERGRLWPHAWCEIGDQIAWCPTTGESYHLTSWNEVLQPAVFDAFTSEQAVRRAIDTDSAGPWPPLQKGQHGLVIVEAAAGLLSDYARTFPGLLAWVAQMRERDPRFADDLQELERDPIAAVDLLAALMERPELWRRHTPGSSWPYRLHKQPGSARVIHPEAT